MYICAIGKVTNIYDSHLCDDCRLSGDDPTDTFKSAKTRKYNRKPRKRSSRAEGRESVAVDKNSTRHVRL